MVSAGQGRNGIPSESPNRDGGKGRRAARWAAATLLCPLALLALPLCAADGASPHVQVSFGRLGDTVLTAIVTTTDAGEAIGALGDSLALNEARNRIAAEARAAANAPSQPRQKPEPVAADPASMPAASAGLNGSISPNAAASGGKIFAHSRAASAPGSSNAILITGIALAPPDAPEAVKGVINNANEIAGAPYVWGGGHASFYSTGYDCSGAVSFALFGGGLIPEPLASVPLESWGSPRSGPVDHRLRERRTRLRRDRRPALGHGRRRPGHRPALAPRPHLHRRLRRPPPAGPLTGAQLPNQRARRLEPKCSFSATRAADGALKLPVRERPGEKSMSTLPTRPWPNSM